VKVKKRAQNKKTEGFWKKKKARGGGSFAFPKSTPWGEKKGGGKRKRKKPTGKKEPKKKTGQEP